jgi:hypothetical protein
MGQCAPPAQGKQAGELRLAPWVVLDLADDVANDAAGRPCPNKPRGLLGLDIGLAGLPLSVEGIELQVEIMLGGLARVDGAPWGWRGAPLAEGDKVLSSPGSGSILTRWLSARPI